MAFADLIEIEIENWSTSEIFAAWANWTAEDGSVVCLTLNCYSLNGTKVEVGDKIQTALCELDNER